MSFHYTNQQWIQFLVTTTLIHISYALHTSKSSRKLSHQDNDNTYFIFLQYGGHGFAHILNRDLYYKSILASRRAQISIINSIFHIIIFSNSVKI